MKSGFWFQSFWSSRLTTAPRASASPAARGRPGCRCSAWPAAWRGSVAAQVLFQGGKAEGLHIVMLKQRSAVDHRVQLTKVRDHLRRGCGTAAFVFKISIKRWAQPGQISAGSYGGIHSILGRGAVVHGHLPAPAANARAMLRPRRWLRR